MNINKQLRGKYLVLTIEDKDANLSNSSSFKELVVNEIESGSIHLIISFEQVKYIDSSFLGALVAILKNLVQKNGSLKLVELNSDIINLFELTRLDKIFDLRASVETALD
ncbi:STAS domain-containing protein [Pedobacter deserti]|uniref:STAS domain-containing protein n=1 Tax=Pedobacter deserti TaxID=2817382 RepID=UPI00210B6C6A|nr:STAS domain-containing protein [Pedobacter sp. SYSU D00382]